MSFFELINPIDKYKQLELRLSYSKGGYNYFTNKESKRGYYVHFTPCNYTVFDNNCALMETAPMIAYSFKFLVKETSRYSEKVYNNLNKTLELNQEHIVKLYENGVRAKDFQDLYTYLCTIFEK